MKTFQARTLEAIEALAGKFKVECTQSSDWANTGRIMLHAPGNPTPFGFVGYDFQGSTFVLRLTIDGRNIPSQPGRADYFDFYQRTDAPTAFWSTFEQLLKTRGAASNLLKSGAEKRRATMRKLGKLDRDFARSNRVED